MDRTEYMVCFALETTQPTQAQIEQNQVKDYRRLFTQQGDRLKELTKGQLTEKATLITDFQAVIQAETMSGAFLPKIVQMDWCICNVRQNFKVVEVACVYIDTEESISPETEHVTGVNQAKVSEEGIKFRDAMIKVSTG